MKISIAACAVTSPYLLALVLTFASGNAAAQDAVPMSFPGKSLESLLAYARQHNPEIIAMRHDAEAIAQRVVPAGALPDPMLRIELENITNYSAGMNGAATNTPPSILPAPPSACGAPAARRARSRTPSPSCSPRSSASTSTASA